ncbi:hypothetical protein [Microvirgula curvata]
MTPATFGWTSTRTPVSLFTPMYTAVTHHRQMGQLKLVRVGPDERMVGIHDIGHGMDEVLHGFAVALKMGVAKKELTILWRYIPWRPRNL